MLALRLPTRLADARQLTHQGQLPEADTAQRKHTDEGPRTSAPFAPVSVLYGKLRLPLGFDDLRYLRQKLLLGSEPGLLLVIP